MELDPDDVFRDDEDDPENELFQVFFHFSSRLIFLHFLCFFACSVYS